jgi:type I restriction enzyme, S subunit
LEGLDATILNLSAVKNDNAKQRIDDGYFSKLAVLAQQRIENLPHVRLGEACATFRKGIFDIKAESYVDEGVPFIHIGDLKDGLIDDSNLSFITEDAHVKEAATALVFGDVVLSKTAYAAASLVNVPRCNVCQDTIAVQIDSAWKKKLLTGYLVTYLNTKHGLALLERQFQGNIQAHLSLPDGRKIPVPLFGEAFQKPIHDTLLKADALQVKARETIAQAEQTLLQAIGLKDWQPPEPLTYTRRASEALAAERFDSEYFAPHVAQLLTKLSADGLTIRDVAPARHDSFDAAKHTGETFDYIEISGLRSDGTATSEATPTDEAPSRASQLVRKGDIITSTVRPIRRLSAIIAPEQDGHVCSSGFVVLNPASIAPEVLLTYLRLPVICELMDLHTSASLYPAISERDLLTLPIPKILDKVSTQIITQVRQAHVARQQAQAFLTKAKRAVEVAIEEGEAAALEFIN